VVSEIGEDSGPASEHCLGEIITSTDGARHPADLAAPVALAPQPAHPGDRVRGRASLVAALAGHAVVIGLLALASRDITIGGPGADFEAIGVDIIPATALDTASAADNARASSQAAIDAREGAIETAERAPPAADRRETPPLVPEKSEPAAQVDLVLPDWVQRFEPPDPEALRLAIAAERGPGTDDNPRPLPAARPAPAPAAAAPAETAAEAGGAPSQSLDAVDPASSARAKAATGADLSAYNRELLAVLGQLRQHVEKAAIRSPAGARGRVVLRLTIGIDGAPSDIGVATSSGSRDLDTRAMAAVQTFRFPPPPRLASTRERTYDLPIRYR